MKKYLTVIVMSLLLVIVIIFINPITDSLAYLLAGEKVIKTPIENEYSKDDNFLFVDISDDFVPYSYQDLINITFTFFNNGWDSFTFYCPKEYSNCLNDMESIINDSSLVTHINNYVHPYNSFNEIKLYVSDSGEITINSYKLYSLEDINAINSEIDIMLNDILDSKDDYDESEKLMLIHDHIINNTSYDVNADPSSDIPSKSNTAYGLLFNNLAICGGYADTMAIILEKLNIPNYKIASETHVWNAVFVDDEWLHLDLTWDDPVNNTKPEQDYLYHKYFLVNNSTLTLEDGILTEHEFDKSIYLEFNY